MSKILNISNFSNLSSITDNNLTTNEDFKNLKNNSSESMKLFCKNCKKTPKIKFDNLPLIKLTCNCYKEKLFTLENIYNNFLIDLEYLINDTSYKNYEKYFKCEKHNYMVFQFFCNDCGQNLCKECIKSHICVEQNGLVDFNRNYYQQKQVIKFIDDAFYGDKEISIFENNFIYKELLDKDLDNIESDNINYLKIIVSTLLYENYTSPNMEIINNLANLKNMLTNDFKIYDKNEDIHQNYEIFSEYEYDNYINELKVNKDLIKKIEINGYNFNIKILENSIFKNLEKLILKGNNISDIIKFIFKSNFR